MRTLSRRQRQAVYNWLTCRAYAYSNDDDRAASLRIRNFLMRDTLSKTNRLEQETKLRSLTVPNPDQANGEPS